LGPTTTFFVDHLDESDSSDVLAVKKVETSWSAQHQVERRSELKKIAREAGTPSRFVRSNLLLCCR
ncbi:MAG: hypothetical protein K1Y01_18250, partial [Vicinamibacteria bacterium]|nr:hypothetical protein [Vicinamibacteria bacterium]